MPELNYKEALKRGQKEYRLAQEKNENPYLPSLDDLLDPETHLSERSLGLEQIPSEWIVGTRHQSRSNMFARNFMPLAEEGTEFAFKWEYLCQSHLEEGIREPIKAYEYMNRYYVEEGNKRVSVLRFFDAVSIPAQVIRLMPEKSDAPEIKRYYELISFYALSGLNNIEFSRPGSCAVLQKLIGKEPQETWSEDERKNFVSAYYIFRDVYLHMGGEKLKMTAGDAMLAYLKVYGAGSLKGKTSQEIKQAVSMAWEEISLQQEESPIEVKMDPVEKNPGLINKVLAAADPRILKTAFIHDMDPRSSSWTRGHEEGRLYLERSLPDQLETKAYPWALESDPEAVIQQAIRDGNTVLFTTSPRLLPAALKAAVENPQVTVFNCSLNQSHRYIRTYYPRMYEVKFIIGAIAGALAGSSPVGYLCDYPIFGQIAGINAFALGVQMVNPQCKVFLEWSSVGGLDAALDRLQNQGVRLISSQDLVRLGEWRPLGLSLLEENGTRKNLATPLWQWGSYYEQLIKLIRSRSEQTDYKESGKALNYYWGLSAGVVDLMVSEDVPPATRNLASLLKKSIQAGICNPFKGPLYTQGGKVLENDQMLSPQQILDMDYLVENVIGQIPAYHELSDTAKATVDQVGIEAASKDRQE